MRLRDPLRLMLALLALGAALAGPAAAARAISAPAMPCHEAGLGDMAPSLSAALSASSAVSNPAPAADRATGHLCCVLSQLVVMPLGTAALRVPESHLAARGIPMARELSGVAPSTPVPPPRFH